MNTPLRIDALQLSCGGEIGMTLCPGKTQAGGLSGNWKRDLATDIRAIHEWGAVAVLTVMEARELRELAVPEIGEAVEQAGMDWCHLPIPDGGVPDANFEISGSKRATGYASRSRPERKSSSIVKEVSAAPA